jgi:4-amino-4-deoxy-L-arabinose transferase-like glycosyltransferase
VAAHLRGLLIAGFVLVALAFAFTSPIFEKNDEPRHFAFARHLAMGGDLPVQQAGVETAWRQSGSQPPLYYALASVIIRLFDTSDFTAQTQPNQSPQFSPYASGNKNLLVITPEKRAFAYRNTTLAAFTLRVMGIVAGVVTLLATWSMAMLLTQRRSIAALATAFTGFNPMFATVMTAVSNDGLVIALSSVALWLIVRWVLHGATWRLALITGVIIGLAAITKVSGLTLLPIAALAALFAAWPARRWKQLLMQWACLLLPVLVIAAWWFARNFALYGDPTGTAMMAAVAGARPAGAGNLINEFQGLRMSYLALFGHFNVPVPAFVYALWDGLLLVSAAGLALRAITHWRNTPANLKAAYSLIVLHVLLTVIALARWTTMTTGSEGRLLFPCIAGISLLMALGLDTWRALIAKTPLRTVAPAALGLPAIAFIALAIYAPFGIVQPAYGPPYVTAIPAGFTPIQQTLKPWAEVLAYKMEPEQARPGDTVRVKVILRALQVPAFNHSLVVNLYGRDATPLGRFDTFTGNGLLPSSQWRAGDLWQDTVAFSVPTDAIAPAMLRAQFNLYNAGSGEIAESVDASGNAGAPLYAGSTLLPLPAPASSDTEATYGGLIALEQHALGEAQAGQPLTITLNWRSIKPASVDVTAFVHVVDAGGTLVAQSDGPLLNGGYPSTRWGDARFVEQRRIDLPADLKAGEYRVLLGFYDPQSGTRLEAVDANGNRVADDAFVLGTFSVR